MIEIGNVNLSGERARALLRKLRDLNLSSGAVAVGQGAWVKLAGCLSLDAPVEKGVRYRVQTSQGASRLLEIAWSEGVLSVATGGLGPHASSAPLAPERCIRVPVTCDRKGRVCAKALGARVTPESTDTRELERFLRRVVKTLFR